MKIGLLKEAAGENRVALTPEIADQLIKMSHQVLCEQNAGDAAFLSDGQYQDAGVEMLPRKEVFEKSDMILCVQAPLKEEIEKLQQGKTLVSVINPLIEKETVKLLLEKGVTAFSLDMLPRTSKAQSMDILSSMATVAGYKAVIDAARLLPRFFPMFMSAAGTIKPAKVLILGAGVAGLQAVSIARKLGAVVHVFDVRSAVKEEVQSLGGKFVEVEGAKDDASAGGYAVDQDEDFKKRQAQAIHDHAINANVVICTAQIPGRKAPLLVKKDTVKAMQKGAVIIDLAASTGGNCELTENAKTIQAEGITIVGESNYPSLMPYDASYMFAKNVYNFLKHLLGDEAQLNIDLEDEIIKGACVTHNKEIVNERVKSIF